MRECLSLALVYRERQKKFRSSLSIGQWRSNFGCLFLRLVPTGVLLGKPIDNYN